MQMKRPCDLRRRFVARTAIRAALAFAALSLVLGTARADFVVLAASGTSDGLETGTRLADDARIALQKGAKVTLMSRDGRMLTLEGSYSGLVDPQSDAPAGAKGSRGPLEKLSRLLQGADARSTVLGAARAGAGTVPRRPVSGTSASTAPARAVCGRDLSSSGGAMPRGTVPSPCAARPADATASPLKRALMC